MVLGCCDCHRRDIRWYVKPMFNLQRALVIDADISRLDDVLPRVAFRVCAHPVLPASSFIIDADTLKLTEPLDG